MAASRDTVVWTISKTFAGGQDGAAERDGLRGNDRRRRRSWCEKFQSGGGREKGARRMPENGKRSYNGITIRNNISDNNSNGVKGGQRVKTKKKKNKKCSRFPAAVRDDEIAHR